MVDHIIYYFPCGVYITFSIFVCLNSMVSCIYVVFALLFGAIKGNTFAVLSFSCLKSV